MGLDMYLEKCDRKAWGYKDIDPYEVKDSNPKLYEKIKPFLVERDTYTHWESIYSEVGYWRKANAIHKWFVDNVQDGNDDCGDYEVSKEQLEDLLNICKTIVAQSVMINGQVKNGETYEDGKWVPIFEDGQLIVNPEIAMELLPTQDGFFFGSTEYDQWYMEDVKDTVDILTRALETTDFDRQMIVYTSSW